MVALAVRLPAMPVGNGDRNGSWKNVAEQLSDSSLATFIYRGAVGFLLTILMGIGSWSLLNSISSGQQIVELRTHFEDQSGVFEKRLDSIDAMISLKGAARDQQIEVIKQNQWSTQNQIDGIKASVDNQNAQIKALVDNVKELQREVNSIPKRLRTPQP